LTNGWMRFSAAVSAAAFIGLAATRLADAADGAESPHDAVRLYRFLKTDYRPIEASKATVAYVR
jgi:hypothetical protein